MAPAAPAPCITASLTPAAPGATAASASPARAGQDAGQGDEAAQRQRGQPRQALPHRAAHGGDAAHAHQHRAHQVVGRVLGAGEAFPAETPRGQRHRGRSGDDAEDADDADGEHLAGVAEQDQPVHGMGDGGHEGERLHAARAGGQEDALQRHRVLGQ